jgi:hypothetical protein
MERRDSETSLGEQMPPLASELVDTDAVAAVRTWILAMDPAAAGALDESVDGAASEETGPRVEEPPVEEPAVRPLFQVP